MAISEPSPAAWPAQAVCLQFSVRFGDPEANLAVVRRRLAELAPAASALVVLPELWGGGFAYERLKEQAALTPGLLAALEEEARRYQVCLAGSLPEAVARGREKDFYNSLYLVTPAGVVGPYRKQRLFAPMEEERYFRPGPVASPLAAPWGPLAALVCFDLRFPELAGGQVDQGAELLVVAAQWPAARREHWRILLQARAIENQVFVVACNTCGLVGGTDFAGSSLIIAPDGVILAEAGPGEESLVAPLDFARLVEARRLFRTRRR
ncbi:nitrilase-related carbon-nitrogen hydrolase [Desulfurivibrio sp. D14AmB]|uniref:nitrilase-related carbon-nitrogen hydrolase n=1 Tax=Desulfurivibrio sp. D14AmB TaxID=3374370 RepID=UPI00376EDBDE